MRIYIDALNESPKDGSWASLQPNAIRDISHIALDFRPAVEAVSAAAERFGQGDRLTLAFAELEGTFGWDTVGEDDPMRLPRRLKSDFFGTGPYFDRARILLAVELGQVLDRRRTARLQAALDYLETPAPIDSWKRFIGTEPGRPRLVHMLGAWGVELGLASTTLGSVATLRDASLDRCGALYLIQRGEARVGQLAEAVPS